jgi:ATP-dependent dihydroxyacetone kinase
MKKLINDPRGIVREMLEGFVDLAPGQALLDVENVIIRADLPDPAARKVAVLSGGGSGHEPAHGGFVGEGCLTAAVAGDVFTSPSVDAVLAGILAASGPAGAVLIVKNYTGDRLNFGLAAELAAAEGIPTEVVVVADDAALRDVVEPGRRRGIAGTVLVHKIAGAAAEAGRPLGEVARLARAAAAEVSTMGVGLDACTVPTAGKPGFVLGEDEMELGLGIHGEKGVERGPMLPADAVADRILDTVLADLRPSKGERVVLLVNGLGGTPPMELAVVARRALARLREEGLSVERAWAGNLMTALEMPGCSISVMRTDAERLSLIDAPTSAPAWPGSGRIRRKRNIAKGTRDVPLRPRVTPGPLAKVLQAAATSVAAALEQAEPHLTDLDSRAGDGDLGASMARGAAAIRAIPASAWATPETAFVATADALRRSIAGSSGPFYATALMRAGRRIGHDPVPSVHVWTEAFAAAVASIGEIGGARPGDRTMLDALAPALEAWTRTVQAGGSPSAALRSAAEAAEDGAAATATMEPRLGRASYLGKRAVGTPDGGAVAVAIWLRALAEAAA